MNETLREISSGALFFAQAGDPLQNITSELSRSVPNLLYAILILVIGWLIAIIAASAVKGILSRTNLDNRLAASLTGRSDGQAVTNIESWVASAVFWIIMIFVIVAFLQRLQLDAVSEPLNDFLGQIFAFLPKLAGAAILLGVAWLIATVAKLLLTRGLKAFSLDEKLNQAGSGGTARSRIEPPMGPTSGTTQSQLNQPTGGVSGTAQYPGDQATGGPGASSPFLLSDTLGNALYWFIFLLFLPAILDTLGLQGLLEPVQNLLDQILGILPKVLAAVLIGVVGWFIARIVRLIVTNLLTATGVDRLGRNFGMSQATGGRGLSWLIGYIVYVLILIPAAIAALNTLQLEVISEPATDMLEQILNSLPLIFTAALILAIAYVIGKFVADLVTNILTSIGFDNVFHWLGIQERPGRPTAPTPGPTTGPVGPSLEPPTTGLGSPTPGTTSTTGLGGPTPGTTPATEAALQTKSPSEIIGIIVLVGIMLFAAVTATNVLGFEALTVIVSGLILVLGRILAGLVVFAVGLYLANLAYRLILSSGSGQANILAQTARIAIIALVSAMALQQMGIASSIVNLAFGLLLGAIAVAVALAFGLGSMDIAAGEVRGWLDSFKRKGGS